MGQGPSSPVPGTKYRVIGAGMSRTGTKSFAQALTILLGPVHDSGTESVGGPRNHQDKWREVMELAPRAKSVADRTRVQWLLAALTEGYSATVDMPANLLTPELLQLYPDAVVIVTTRDPKSWWKSVQLMKSLTRKWYLPLLLWPVPTLRGHTSWQQRANKMVGWRYGFEDHIPSTLEQHEQYLREVVPPERLHWYRCSEGWEPLCKILNVPVPDVPFPHNNTPNEAHKVFRNVVTMAIMIWISLIATTGFAGWLAWRQLRVYW